MPDQQSRTSVHYIPVSFTYTILRLGHEPQHVENERRHMKFSNYSYSRMLKELGVKKLGNGEPEQDSVRAAIDSLDDDPIRKSSVMIWASLVDEDPDLSVDRVMKMVDISRFKELILEVVRAMTYYTHGPDAHEEADKAVREASDKVREQEALMNELADQDEGAEKNG